MTHLSFLRRSVRALLPLAFLGAAAAPAASAADAPYRTIARNVAGDPVQDFHPVGVSTDGREMIGTLYSQVLVRDVAAGTTSMLVASGRAVSATPDLRYVLVTSEAQLTPQDTDDTADAYELDRTTGALSLVTAPGSLKMADGTTPDRIDFAEYQLSGDGRYVGYRVDLTKFDPIFASPGTEEFSAWKWDRTTGASTKLRDLAIPNPTGTEFTITHTDKVGRIAITSDGALDGARLVPLPVSGNAMVSVSADGNAIAATNRGSGTVALVATSTGAVTNVTLPSWLASSNYRILGVGNGGSGFLVAVRLARTAGPRDAIGWVTRAGVLSQVGGDLLATNDIAAAVVSENVQFAANGLVLGKLGTVALPGTEPGAGVDPPITNYMRSMDTYCSQQPFGGVAWTRAFVELNAVARGTDTRVPASATVKVFNTATPTTVYNAFTLTGSSSRQLTVPRTGGWAWAATVTFTNGTKITGSEAVPTHPIEACTPFYWF